MFFMKPLSDGKKIQSIQRDSDITQKQAEVNRWNKKANVADTIQYILIVELVIFSFKKTGTKEKKLQLNSRCQQLAQY